METSVLMVAKESAEGATGSLVRKVAMAVLPTTMLTRGERKTAFSASAAVSAAATPSLAIAAESASAAEARAARSSRRSSWARWLASEESVGDVAGSGEPSQAASSAATVQSTAGIRMGRISGGGLG